MVTQAGLERHTYFPGEEVLLRLETGVRVMDAEAGEPVPPCLLPPWTIARILSRSDDGDTYVASFRNGGSSCLCTAPAATIDGVV